MRALTAERRATRRARSASVGPSADLGVADASPLSAARAAASASVASDFPPPAPGLAIGPVHLDHCHPLAGQKAGQAGPVGTRALDADAHHRAPLAHPGQQLPVAGQVGWERFSPEDPPGAVDHRRNVHLAVGVHPAGHLDRPAGHPRLFVWHACLAIPFARRSEVGTTGRDGGQDSHGALPRLLSGHVRPTGWCAIGDRGPGRQVKNKARRPVTPWVRPGPISHRAQPHPARLWNARGRHWGFVHNPEGYPPPPPRPLPSYCYWWCYAPVPV